jgi:hypothetical protein
VENEKKGRLLGLAFLKFFLWRRKPKEGKGKKWKNQT